MKLPRGLAPLRERDFALYWYGQATSQIGSWADVTATSWLLYELTGSPLLLGLGGLIRAAPIVGLALLGGVVADRLPRRQLLLGSQAAQMTSALLLGVIVATGLVEFWHIYIFGAINSIFTAFEQPARLALYPSLVSRGQLQNAVALQAMLFRISTLVGPALAGVLIARVGPAAPFFANAVSFLAILTALTFIRVPAALVRVRGSIAAETVDGLRYAMRHPILPIVLLVEVTVSFFGHNTALITIYASDVLHVGAQGLGIMLSAIGAGALLGIGALLTFGDVRRKGAAMLVGGAAYTLAFLTFGLAPAFAVAVAALLVLGLADSIWGAMRNTILQTSTEDAYRGRVMSMSIITTRGFTSISQMQTGAVVSLIGPPGAVVIGATALGAALLAAAVRGESLRGFGSVAPRPLPEEKTEV